MIQIMIHAAHNKFPPKKKCVFGDKPLAKKYPALGHINDDVCYICLEEVQKENNAVCRHHIHDACKDLMLQSGYTRCGICEVPLTRCPSQRCGRCTCASLIMTLFTVYLTINIGRNYFW